MRNVVATSTVVWCALLAGCVSQNSLDPRGEDFSVSAAWTVNGSAPSPESCGAAGIEEVRIAFYESSQANYFDELEVCCSVGSLSTEPVLAYARHRIELQAHDLHKGGGTTAAATEKEAFLVESPETNLDLTPGGPFDFVYDDGDRDGVRIIARWTVAGGSASQAACDAAGVDTLRLRAFAASDTAFAMPLHEWTAACKDGAYDSNGVVDGDTTPLPNGAIYLLESAALDGSDAVVEQVRTESPVDASCVERVTWPELAI